MPFEKGHKHSAKSRPFGDALRRALAQYDKSPVKAGQAMRHIADAAIEKAVAGEMDAIKFIAERMDGKPDQSIDVAVKKSAAEYSDDELAAIVAAASSEGTAGSPDGA